ncbi:MAG: MFS transporter [Gammaproteobacteria bacterium]
MSVKQSAASAAGEDSFSVLGRIYDHVTGDEDARVCKDIPDSACRHQPINFFAYLVSNTFTKIADELASARLILPWLLGVLGAPAAFVGFLVPIREAGVLLPQLLVAAWIRRLALRRGVWILGTGLCALAMLALAFSIPRISGPQAGWIVLGLITLFSLAKGICSVSAKDVLGKTVSKTRRGVLMGYSAGIAGGATLGIGLYVEYVAVYQQSTDLFFWFFIAAGIIYLCAIVVFMLIREEVGSTEGGGNAIAVALKSLAVLRTDPVFRHFVIARTLLLSVALVIPFYVLLAQEYSDNAAGLGLMIIAGGLAASVSSPVWGRIGDYSSRLTMVIAAVAAGITGMAVWLFEVLGVPFLSSVWTWTGLFFLISAWHNGVRLGRKVYIVDMSGSDTRATYVAVSNTVIGAAMLIGGGIGILADILDTSSVIGLLGIVALFSALYINRLPEVSG